MVNIVNTLTEKNKELLEKNEESEKEIENLRWLLNNRKSENIDFIINRVIETEDEVKDLKKALASKEGNEELKEVHKREIGKLKEEIKRGKDDYNWILKRRSDLDNHWGKQERELKDARKEIETLKKDSEEKVEKLEARIEELEERVDIEVEMNLKALEVSNEWHQRKVFEVGMRKDGFITDLRLKVQELENALAVRDERITRLSKPTKLQKVRKSVKATKEKVYTKVNTVRGKVQEKLCAYVLQSNILQKNK